MRLVTASGESGLSIKWIASIIMEFQAELGEETLDGRQKDSSWDHSKYLTWKMLRTGAF